LEEPQAVQFQSPEALAWPTPSARESDNFHRQGKKEKRNKEKKEEEKRKRIKERKKKKRKPHKIAFLFKKQTTRSKNSE
jgi:hypothetical protein